MELFQITMQVDLQLQVGMSSSGMEDSTEGYTHRYTQFGGLQVFANQTRKSKQCIHKLYACLSSHSYRTTCRLHTHLTNHDYFDFGKNPKTPKLSPIQGLRWRRLWYLWCTSVATHQLKEENAKCKLFLRWT